MSTTNTHRRDHALQRMIQAAVWNGAEFGAVMHGLRVVAEDEADPRDRANRLARLARVAQRPAPGPAPIWWRRGMSADDIHARQELELAGLTCAEADREDFLAERRRATADRYSRLKKAADAVIVARAQAAWAAWSQGNAIQRAERRYKAAWDLASSRGQDAVFAAYAARMR